MPTGLKAKQRRNNGGFSAGEAVRALIASAALAAILLLAIFVTSDTYFSAQRQARNAVSKITPLPQSPGGEAGHRMASTVVGTDSKGRCEERQFDNRTGRIVSSSYVDCDGRLATERDTAPSENLSAERMRAIFGAFRR